MLVVEARGGGRGGGRGRGRGSHSAFYQRSSTNYKPSSNAEAKQFEWSKVGRLVGRIFGGSEPKPIVQQVVAKGYQGKYVPKNIYHPKKPKPVAVRADRMYEEDAKHKVVTSSSIIN